MSDQVCIFEQERGRLFGLAYRMSGSVAEAEDIVQEAHLRWIQQEHAAIENPPAWLLTVVTRLGIDWQRSQRHRRESYMGVWLPEPLVHQATLANDDPAGQIEFSTTLSLAFMHLLERLNPQERAVILLREAFDWRFNDIAVALGATDTQCRQWYRRAHKKLGHEKTMTCPDASADRLLFAFLQTCMSGEMTSLLSFLREDVMVYSDGGGKVTALLRPISGSERVARFLLRLFQPRDNLKVIMKHVNGEPGLLVYEQDRAIAALVFAFHEQGLWRLFSIQNPDKLKHLHHPG